jgi:hypothetical protein
MTPAFTRSSLRFEIIPIVSVCGLLFIAAFRDAGPPLWSIPAMTLFLLTAVLSCVVYFKAPRRGSELSRWDSRPDAVLY